MDLLVLDGASAPLQWSMRMIGVTLIALAANMWAVSMSGGDRALVGVGLAFLASLLWWRASGFKARRART